MGRTYWGVQALRGLAAMTIVAFHVSALCHEVVDPKIDYWFAGRAGVDLFFAISGFIMVMVTRDIWGKTGVAWPFLQRRLIRILPLYWLLTTVQLLMLLISGDVALQPWYVIASYLLIPAYNPELHLFPLIVAGWTLYSEMLFYLLFTAVLLLRKPPILLLSLLLLLLALIGAYCAPIKYAALSTLDPRLLEFVFGMIIAKLALSQRLSNPPIAWGLVAFSLVSLLLSYAYLPAETLRNLPLLFRGVPMAMLLYAIVSLEDCSLWRHRLLRSVGDASYAIYLSHGFGAVPLKWLILTLGLSGNSALAVALIISLPLTCILGIAIHQWIEKPILAWLRGQRAGAPVTMVANSLKF